MIYCFPYLAHNEGAPDQTAARDDGTAAGRAQLERPHQPHRDRGHHEQHCLPFRTTWRWVWKTGAGLYVPLPECTGTLCTIFGSYVPYIGYIRIMVGLLLSVEDPVEG